jgi:hypothetical protein
MELDKLKQLLGIDITDNTKDIALQFVIDDTTEIIMSYCNLEELPSGLSNTAYRMAIDLYRNENLGDENIPLGSVSSISEGDTTVNYRSNIAEFKDTLIKDYRVQLNRYRKLVW